MGDFAGLIGLIESRNHIRIKLGTAIFVDYFINDRGKIRDGLHNVRCSLGVMIGMILLKHVYVIYNLPAIASYN